MTPNPDLLRIEFLGITAHHDEVGMPREDLALFFAGLRGPYGLSRLEYHSDAGATYSGPDGAECVLRPGQIASCGVTSLGYREGLGRVVGLLTEAVERYGIGPLWVDDVTLVAVWDVEDSESARDLLVGSMLQIDEERLDLLGGDDVSLGLRIWRRSGDSALEVAIEPMHSEPSKVYLRLVQSQSEPMDAASVVEAADSVHDFLQGPLKSFVLARARR